MNTGIRAVYAVVALVLVAVLRVLALAGLDQALLAVLVRGAHWPRQAVQRLLEDGNPGA